ncbi:MAG: VWA domain-containing protein [Myxococcota bacterium]
MRFAHPDAFWLLLLVVLLALLMWRAERVRLARLAKLAEDALLPPLTSETSRGRRLWRHALTVLGCTLCVVALARPQAGTRVELEKTHGVNVVMAVDVSKSMWARDVAPDRLRRAQAELGDLMESLRGNRVGLVAFAGVAYAPCPLTTDIGAAKLFLRNLSPEAVPQGGTAIARALATARALFRAEARTEGQAQPTSKAANIIVLVTDGEDHEGDLETEAKALKDEGIMLYAVGVGSTLGEPIPLPSGGAGQQLYMRDASGQTVLTRLNEAALQKLAEDAGGAYVSGQGGGLGLQPVKEGIAAIQKAELESRLVVAYDERYAWVLAPGLFCLVLSRLLRLRARGTVPTAQGATLPRQPQGVVG